MIAKILVNKVCIFLLQLRSTVKHEQLRSFGKSSVNNSLSYAFVVGPFKLTMLFLSLLWYLIRNGLSDNQFVSETTIFSLQDNYLG